MYSERVRLKPTLRPMLFVFTTLLVMLLASYWQNGAYAAAETRQNGSVPPGTIPPGPSTPSDKARVTVIHAAPFDANVDNTAVDICTQDGTLVSGLTALKYLYNASVVVDPGTYDWKVAEAGTSCANEVLDLAPFTLITQQEVVLILTGDGTNQAVDALLFVSNGGVNTIYLPVVARQ